MDENKYITVPDAAGVLGIKQRTLHAQLSKGRIPYEVILGRKVILRTVLEDYKQRTQPDGRPQTGRPKKTVINGGAA